VIIGDSKLKGVKLQLLDLVGKNGCTHPNNFEDDRRFLSKWRILNTSRTCFDPKIGLESLSMMRQVITNRVILMLMQHAGPPVSLVIPGSTYKKLTRADIEIEGKLLVITTCFTLIQNHPRSAP